EIHPGKQDLVSKFIKLAPDGSWKVNVMASTDEILQQMGILRDSGKCQGLNDILPLVQVRDVMQYMPQMKYMFSRMSGGEENPSKRQRTS
ncbi:hypothetical protein L9F63_000357, partial [Diploptera punctata]